MIRSLSWRLIGIILLGAAAWVLWREFQTIRPAHVVEAMRAWGPGVVAAAIGLSALSFLVMGFVEWMGLRWAGARVGLPAALGGSFVASAMGHSLGANLIVSGAVRARIYARHGVGIGQAAAATLFQGVSVAIGLTALAGVGLLAAGDREIAASSRIANPLAEGLGLTLLAAVVAYILLCALLRRPLRGFGHSVRLPSPQVALAQVTIGALDNAIAAAIFWILLPAESVTYLAFAAAYAPSVAAGLISHMPGGVGVFEGSISTLLKGLAPAPLAAAFLGYRLFFFLLPLFIASLYLALDTLRRRVGNSG